MTERRRTKVRRDFCPSCGRLTAYRLDGTSIHGAPRPDRLFRPHNNRAGAPCPVRGTSERISAEVETWTP